MFLVFLLLCPFLSAKLGGLRACRLTPPHLMRLLVNVLSNKKTWFITDYSLFLQRFVIELYLHAGHVWGFFSFLFFLFLFVLEDVPFFLGWFQHGIHTSFVASSLFWDSNKKVSGLPTSPTPCQLCVRFSCVEVHHHRLSLGCSECAMHSCWKWTSGETQKRLHGNNKTLSWK